MKIKACENCGKEFAVRNRYSYSSKRIIWLCIDCDKKVRKGRIKI